MKRAICYIHDVVCSSSRWSLPSCLSLRFNCGTGAAQIISDSRVVVGQWHTVTVFRDGMSGWLRMDNDTPISGRSQVTEEKVVIDGASFSRSVCRELHFVFVLIFLVH